MTTEFELLTQDALRPRTKRLLCEALDRFQQCITPDITSDAEAGPLLARIVDELTEAHLTDNVSVLVLASEHPAAFFGRSPKSRPPDVALSPAQLVKQNVREWLDYELWAKWYLASEFPSVDEISARNKPPLPDLPLNYYIAVGGNDPLYLRYYAGPPQSDWWFVELVVDYDTHDHSLTFGPLSRDDLIGVVEALRGTYCTIYENWMGPLYISDRLRMQEERKSEDAKSVSTSAH